MGDGGILALDQATVIGWAFCDPGREPVWGHQRMGRDRAESGEAFFAFRRFLLGRIGHCDPTYLVFESPFTPRADRREEAKPLNPQVLRKAYGWVALIEGMAEEFGLVCYEKQTSSFTKWFTGKGRYPNSAAKKRATVLACEARGWRVTNDEADALALLMYSESILYPKESRQRTMVLKQPEGPLFGVTA